MDKTDEICEILDNGKVALSLCSAYNGRCHECMYKHKVLWDEEFHTNTPVVVSYAITGLEFCPVGSAYANMTLGFCEGGAVPPHLYSVVKSSANKLKMDSMFSPNLKMIVKDIKCVMSSACTKDVEEDYPDLPFEDPIQISEKVRKRIQ